MTNFVFVKLIGVWIISDAWFSLLTYWGKERFREQHIRWIRLGLGIALVIFG